MSRAPSPRQAASRRLAQLGAVCRLLRREGIQPALAIWGPAVAQTLASAPRCYALLDSTPKAVWPGLTQDSLREALLRMGFKPAGQELSEFIERTAKVGKPVEAQMLGRLIGLTAEQRRKARAWSIVAADQPRRLRKEESAQRRKEQSAKAQAAARRKSGAVSRKEYLESVRAKIPAGKTRNAVNVAACRARMRAGSSALFSIGLKAGPSAGLSTNMKAGSSVKPNINVSGFVSMPMYIGPNGRSIRQVDAASDAHLQRSDPSICPSLGAGFAGEAGSPIIASAKSYAPRKNDGLGDESQSKSEASKKETVRHRRASEEEDPREVIARWIPSTLACDILLDDLGQGDLAIGLKIALDLGRERLLGLQAELDAGAPLQATLAAARAAAFSTSTALAVRRADR